MDKTGRLILVEDRLIAKPVWLRVDELTEPGGSRQMSVLNEA